MHEMRLKGNFIGGIINYGWSLQPTYIEQNGKQVLQATKVVLNEDEAPIVRQMFTGYASGKKATEIANELNKKGIGNRGNCFQAGTIYSMLRQEKYTGIYRVNNIAYDKIYPQIVPIEIYEIVRERLEKNKFGKGAKQNHVYLLKGKMFCGCCGRHMTSYTGSSRPTKLVRYYSCTRNNICSNRTTIRKEILEQGITTSLDTILNNKENLQNLINTICSKYNKNLYDVTSLRLAEKELTKIHTSFTNLFRAVENGFFSDTTNARIQELEKRKAELTEFIVTEKTKEVEPLTEKQVLEYITTANTKNMQTVIDMVVRKVIVQNGLINVYLKYDILNPKDDNPKIVKDPTQILSEQGLLLFSYSQPYYLSPTNKTFLECVPNKELERREFVINIII